MLQKPQTRVQTLPRIISVAVPGRPALAHVGALGRLADGVQLVAVDQVQQLGVLLAVGHLHLQPAGLAPGGGRLGVINDQMAERNVHRLTMVGVAGNCGKLIVLRVAYCLPDGEG